MSLMVAAMLRDPKSGEVHDDPRVELRSQLGGFEEWRVSVWGQGVLLLLIAVAILLLRPYS